MLEKHEEQPFDELPEALVEEMLNQCDNLGDDLSRSFQGLYKQKNDIRKKLKEKDLLRKDTTISVAPSHPTSCGVDGSYAIERLLYTDMVAMAGVAVEGLTPPSEKRYWPKPHHLSKVLTIAHNQSTVLVARAVMICMELELAAKAPHDVILLDGSLTTPFIYLNQALNRVNEVPKNLSSLLESHLEPALKSYETILLSRRTDKTYAGIPKYTTRKEISKVVSSLGEYEDRGLLTFILDAGEFVGPVPIEGPQQPWHIEIQFVDLQNVVRGIISALDELCIVYYRPYDHFPVLRIEIAKSIADNSQRLAVLFESLRLQCGSPSIMEPYPLYLADRMVKHLGTALPAIRRTTTQQMSTEWENKLGNMYLAMHGYRTDWGK
ncbi:MAG: DNA double-strand break repair nuclease NurA [Candidatus Hodarchaeota archaeon]